MNYTIPITVSVAVPNYKSTSSVDDRPEDIRLLHEMCEYLGVIPDDVISGKRHRKIKYCRWVLWDLYYTNGLSFANCGKLIGGNYHHSSVMHALDQLQRDIKQMDWLKKFYNHFNQNTYVCKTRQTK